MGAPPLPPEIVRLILDEVRDLILKDVVRYIFLFSDACQSRGAALLIMDRLAAIPGGNLYMDLHLTLGKGDLSRQATAEQNVRTMLIPALAQCLPRIVTLSIVCDEEFINDVVAALRAGPAPRLKVFKFYGYQHEPRPSTKMKVLPLDLFSGEAPLLRVLQMDACQFPEVPVPAFASVRELIRVADRRAEENYYCCVQLHPERFFISCPALEQLL
ncbi:hypothetical protein AURDEDRAFT_166320, partial [Auricularia subglabra TFB-10046 SS5]